MSFPGTGKIWMNGTLVDWADAKIHVASHVVHYGSAVFEGARCYDTKQGPACFRLDAHRRRLLDSGRARPRNISSVMASTQPEVFCSWASSKPAWPAIW